MIHFTSLVGDGRPPRSRPTVAAAIGLSACGSELVRRRRPEDRQPRRLLGAQAGLRRAGDRVRARPTPASGVKFSASYGASGTQSKAVASGQHADYVAFSLGPDMDQLVPKYVDATGTPARPRASSPTRSW